MYFLELLCVFKGMRKGERVCVCLHVSCANNKVRGKCGKVLF